MHLNYIVIIGEDDKSARTTIFFLLIMMYVIMVESFTADTKSAKWTPKIWLLL